MKAPSNQTIEIVCIYKQVARFSFNIILPEVSGEGEDLNILGSFQNAQDSMLQFMEHCRHVYSW